MSSPEGKPPMSTIKRTVIVCSCEASMQLDKSALAKGCGGTLEAADQLCGRELERAKSLLAGGAPVTIGCTQESPLFTEVAEELGGAGRLAFANLRETGGWSAEGSAAGPKMAALLAAAGEDLPGASSVTMESRGVTLIYGRDEVAIEAARRLADHLDITVLLTKGEAVTPPQRRDFPVTKGTIVAAAGYLGAFDLRIDDFARPAPSSRDRLVFGPGRDGAASRCDLIVDLSGGRPLFPAHTLRPGYVRADPADLVAVERAIFEASHLVGTFDKPRFITFADDLCAHSRSRLTGCTRCLNVCPTGAIVPAGDHVAINPQICAGCGSCATVCPTGAAGYAVPEAAALIRRLRAMMLAFAAAGGTNGIVLFHDRDHGEKLIDALARFGRGLPANVLPVTVNEVTAVGLEAVAALFAYGVAGVRFLLRTRPRHDIAALRQVVDMGAAILAALGYGSEAVSMIEADDPDTLEARLRAGVPKTMPTHAPASFLPLGGKREVLVFAMRELNRVAPEPCDFVPLAAGAPFGGLEIEREKCTLCLSCVSACPTSALTDHPERPMLRFTESLCVQCGLCAATCPEKVISLKPQIDFAAWASDRRVIKEEEPFHCLVCGKPFGTKSSIERVISKLTDRHWMYSGPDGRNRLRVIGMCEDCRVEAIVNESFDPHAAPPRPPPRTSDDYLRERTRGQEDPKR
ncbi:MAG: 4Fe-4S binding protein [Acetobacteraceae bacterium]